jgi:hypothetical protein
MTTDKLWELDALPPGPDGDLTFEIECRTSRGDGPVHRHPITIRRDWSVETGHDIERERVAIAMGSYCSCVEVVDHVVPALWHLVQLRARRMRPTLQLGIDKAKRRVVTVPADSPSAPGARFDEIARAVTHMHSVEAVATIHCVKQDVLAGLLKEIEKAHKTNFFAPPEDKWRAEECVSGKSFDELWDHGVHPELVRRLYERVWNGGCPMPSGFYIGLVDRRPDLGWIAKTLHGVIDPGIANWLVWTTSRFDDDNPTARMDWIWSGVSRRAVDGLVKGKYVAADVAWLARLTSWSVPTCASVLAAWVNAECRPFPEQIADLNDLGIDFAYRPSGSAVDWVCEFPAVRYSELDRTAVGLLLAVCGTRQTTAALLQSGVTSPADAAYILGVDGRIDDERLALVSERNPPQPVVHRRNADRHGGRAR